MSHVACLTHKQNFSLEFLPQIPESVIKFVGVPAGQIGFIQHNELNDRLGPNKLQELIEKVT